MAVTAEPIVPASWASREAERIVGDWLKTMSDHRSVVEMVAAGVEAGYAAGLAVNP